MSCCAYMAVAHPYPHGLPPVASLPVRVQVAGSDMSEESRGKLVEYFEPHTQRLLRDVLPALKSKGMIVHGFTGKPWANLV